MRAALGIDLLLALATAIAFVNAPPDRGFPSLRNRAQRPQWNAATRFRHDARCPGPTARPADWHASEVREAFASLETSADGLAAAKLHDAGRVRPESPAASRPARSAQALPAAVPQSADLRAAGRRSDVRGPRPRHRRRGDPGCRAAERGHRLHPGGARRAGARGDPQHDRPARCRAARRATITVAAEQSCPAIS